MTKKFLCKINLMYNANNVVTKIGFPSNTHFDVHDTFSNVVGNNPLIM